MDNFRVDITAEMGMLENAVNIAFSNISSKATHYKVIKTKRKVDSICDDVETVESDEGTPTLILLWAVETDAIALPFTLDRISAVPFIKTWLSQQEVEADPYFDGSTGEAFRLFNDQWGYVGKYHRAIFAVQAQGAWYGK